MDVFKTLLLSTPGAIGSSVAITGGSINGTNIGATTPGTGAFTTVDANGVHLDSAYTIAAMGDSLTMGGAYIDRLLSKPAFTGWQIRNHGITGQTAVVMNTRFDACVVSRGDVNYVIIWAGINDVVQDASAATIQNALQAMYTAASGAGIKVVAVNITPFKTNADWSAGRQTVLDTVNTWISSTATGIDYIVDAYTALEDPGAADTLLAAYDSGDHLHLSTAGYNVVGDAIATALGTLTAIEDASSFVRYGDETKNVITRAGTNHLWTDAQFTVADTTETTGTGIGALVCKGGASFRGGVRAATTGTFGGVISTTDTTASSSTTTGSIVAGGGVGAAGNITGGGYLSVAGSITSSGNATITGGSLVSNSTSAVLTATATGTSAKYVRLGSTGGSLYLGSESSVGGGFFTGAGAYETVLYSPSNNTYFRTPKTTLSGNLQVNGSQNVLAVPSSADALGTNSTMTFELTSNTSLTIKVRGTDGTTRSVALTLA